MTIPEADSKNRLIAFLRKYLLGTAAGPEPKKIAVINLVTSFTSSPTTLLGSQTLALSSICFSDITVADGLTFTIESGVTLVVKDVGDF